MKNFLAADKAHAGGDEKHDINFHWPYLRIFLCEYTCYLFTSAKCRGLTRMLKSLIEFELSPGA